MHIYEANLEVKNFFGQTSTAAHEPSPRFVSVRGDNTSRRTEHETTRTES